MTYTVSGIAVYSVISGFMAGTKIDDVYKITGFQPFWAILFLVMLCSLFAFGERKKETDFVGLIFMVIIAVSVGLFYNGTKCTISPLATFNALLGVLYFIRYKLSTAKVERKENEGDEKRE